MTERNESRNAGNKSKEYQGECHYLGSLVHVKFTVEFFVFRAPENAIVKAEHIECSHCCNHSHDPTHYRTECEASRKNLVFREEAGERRNTRNGKTRNEERNMRKRHILAHAAHSRHFVAVNHMNNGTGAQEEASLEHCMGEEVEHSCHITYASRMFMTCYIFGANAESNHHKCNLRNCRECEHTLNVRLGTSNSSSIECCERANVCHDMQSLGSISYPKRIHTCHLEHTGNNHRGCVNQCADRRRTFHCIGQPNVKREHCTLTGTTNKHQQESRGKHECSRCYLVGIANEIKTECLAIVSVNKNTDKEAEISETCNYKRFL